MAPGREFGIARTIPPGGEDSGVTKAPLFDETTAVIGEALINYREGRANNLSKFNACTTPSE
eukprot:scaffold3749_cov98-Skeletonema_marinoi.AAC.3